MLHPSESRRSAVLIIVNTIHQDSLIYKRSYSEKTILSLPPPPLFPSLQLGMLIGRKVKRFLPLPILPAAWPNGGIKMLLCEDAKKWATWCWVTHTQLSISQSSVLRGEAGVGTTKDWKLSLTHKLDLPEALKPPLPSPPFPRVLLHFAFHSPLWTSKTER